MKNYKSKILNLKSNAGFTLIELMVAMAIFMIVMLMATGAFFVVSNSAKKAKALRTAMDNVNFAMENISRSLRLGSNYYCTGYPASLSLNSSSNNDCLGGGNAIVFTPYNLGSSEAFQLSTYNNSGVVQKVSSADGTIDLTAPEVNITDLRFFVRGSDSSSNDPNQPSVFILMKGSVNIKGEITNFAVQTLASQRNAE